VLVDPICRAFCCGKSLFDATSKCRKQTRLLQRAEARFGDELDIEHLITKLRDSYDLTRNMVKKDYRKLLAYNRGRVIDGRSNSDRELSSDVSSSSEDETGKKKSGVKSEVKLAVIRGMGLQTKEQKQRIKD